MDLSNDIVFLILSFLYPDDLQTISRFQQTCKANFGLVAKYFNIERAKNTPRVRINGIYIAPCKYWRPGFEEGAQFQPVHLVKYYRFLRFFKDNSCWMVTTPQEPSEVIRRPKNMKFGRYIIKESMLKILLDGGYILKFKIKKCRGRWSTINWQEYSYEDGDTFYYRLDYDKFYFSRVNSY